LQEEIHRVESNLRAEIQSVKAELIKWSFTFWVRTIATLFGIMFTLWRTMGLR
jgi:hypothetical protein